MAVTYGSFQQAYDNPFNPVKANDRSSFTDLFNDGSSKDHQNIKDEGVPFCMMNSESLQMCTEGLGFESLDGVEDLKDDAVMEASNASFRVHSSSFVGSEQYYKREKCCVTSFPPPISSLGVMGKSSVCFKSYRHDGRFVLEEVRIPKQEYLHASREDGRLKLSFVESDDDDDVCGDDDDDEGEIDVIEEHVKGNFLMSICVDVHENA